MTLIRACSLSNYLPYKCQKKLTNDNKNGIRSAKDVSIAVHSFTCVSTSIGHLSIGDGEDTTSIYTCGCYLKGKCDNDDVSLRIKQ